MNARPKPAVPIYLILSLGILAISTASILIRYAQNEAPSLVIAAYRMGIAALILAPLGIKRAWIESRSLSRKQIAVIALAGVFLAIHFAAWITSLEYTSITSSVVLVTTTPLWVAIFSPMILGEKSRKEVWIGLTLAMVGGVIVGFQESCQISMAGLTCEPLGSLFTGKVLLGNGLALLGAWTAAGYMIVGRQIRPHFSLIPYTLIVYGIAALLLLLFVLIGGYSLIAYPPETFFWFLLLAVLPQILGHSSFNWALRYLPAAIVSLALLGEPIGTTILAVILLREPPTILELVGGVLILTGIFLASRSEPASAVVQNEADSSIRVEP